MPNHPSPFSSSPFAPRPPIYGTAKVIGTTHAGPTGPISGGGASGGPPVHQPNGGPIPVTNPPAGGSGSSGSGAGAGGTTSGGSSGGSTAGGGSTGTSAAAPTITKAYAAEDGSGTDTLFSVTGTGLAGVTVEIDGLPAQVTQGNAWTINGKIPHGVETGMVPITVTNSAGSSSATINVKGPKPVIASVNPASGDVSGTQITITGSALSAASAVIIGGVAADVVSNTATSIVATVPATAKIGAGSIVVQTGAGSASKAFTITNAAGAGAAGGATGGGAVDTTTAAGWLAAIEVPSSAAAQAAYAALSTTGGVGLSLAELSQNVSMIAGELGTNDTAASILAALAALGSSYLTAAAPGATFTASQVFTAGGIGAGAQASLASEYNSAVTASNTGGTTITSTTGSSGGGGGSTGGGAAPSAVDPATGQYYAYETDPTTGLPYVIDPASGLPYSLEQQPGSGIYGTNPGIPSAGSTSSSMPLVLLGLAGLAAFYFYEQKQKTQADASAPATAT